MRTHCNNAIFSQVNETPYRLMVIAGVSRWDHREPLKINPLNLYDVQPQNARFHRVYAKIKVCKLHVEGLKENETP